MFEPPFFSFATIGTGAHAALLSSDRPPARVVSVTAPTGYGKTVLLATLHEHYRRAGAECRWLALEDRDIGVSRLLSHLDALVAPEGGKVDVMQALHQGDEPVDARITSILESLALFPAPSVLFIDNLNRCTDETLHQLLDALIFRSPSWVHVVLASTGPIPFDRARAKLEGRLLEIGFADLSLAHEQIRQLLGASLSERMDAGAIDLIRRKTEGWPAAVRLMQIILAAADDPDRALESFSGADEDLAALLNRQVLQGLDGRARQFLLEISLLRTFSVALCREATGDEDAARHLERFLKRNLFLIPLDRNRNWYRLHALFRQFLLDEAQRELKPERQREVRLCAAEWCEQGGYWQDAIDYALEADALPQATAILERVAAVFVRDRGDLRQYIAWVERLHSKSIQCGWEADFWYVWGLVFHRRYESARKQAERLTKRLDAAGGGAGKRAAPEDEPAYRRRIEVIRIAIDTYTDRLEDAYESGTRWLAGVQNDDPFNVATVACASGIHLISMHRLAETRKVMRLAQSYIAQARSDYGSGWVAVLNAVASLQEGDFNTAYQDLLAALTRAKATLGESAGITGTIALVSAKCAVEMNLDAEARELLGLGLRRVHSHGVVETAACGLDAAVKLWTGAPSDPISLVDLREMSTAYPPRLSLMLSCFVVRRLLRLGKADEARDEAAHAGLDRGVSHPGATASTLDLIAATEIELLIAAGKLKQATALVTEQTAVARAAGRSARLVELAVDEATIASCSHNPAPAARHLVRAITLAAKRRYLRPFRDRAEIIAGLVNETKVKDWGFAVEDERRFFTEICRSLPMNNAALHDQLEGLGVVPALSETPTARELELLSLLEAGLTNQQLADRLSVSVATVKWHLYNLYAKLGVSNRSAALARARALSVLVR